MTETLIRIENLHFAYRPDGDRPVPALRGIDLEIGAGEYVAIIGHNGSGKSTLARHLNGLLLPTEGEVWVQGMNTKDPRHRQAIRRTVAMVFQNPDNQIVATVVEEDVAFGPENLGLPEEELRRRVDWALGVVGLSDLRHRAPQHLSAGQKQRLALAGALAMRPQCLVLDEATSMLDPAGRREVLGIVRDLHRQGMAVVAITHAMEEAAEAERVLVMQAGRILLDLPPRQLFLQTERLHSLQLEIPQPTALAQALHRRVSAFPPDCLSPHEVIKAVVRLVGECSDG